MLRWNDRDRCQYWTLDFGFRPEMYSLCGDIRSKLQLAQITNFMILSPNFGHFPIWIVIIAMKLLEPTLGQFLISIWIA